MQAPERTETKTDDVRNGTIDEAAHRYGVHRSTLYGAVQRGELPALRIGRRIVVSFDAIDCILRGEGAV